MQSSYLRLQPFVRPVAVADLGLRRCRLMKKEDEDEESEGKAAVREAEEA